MVRTPLKKKAPSSRLSMYYSFMIFFAFFKDSSCVLLLLNKLFFKIGKDYSLRSGKTGARVAARSSVVSSNVSLRKKPKIVSIWHSQSSRGAVGGGEEHATTSQEEEEE